MGKNSDQRRRRRQEAVLQLGGKCAKEGCESTRDLEFDHIDPTTKVRMISQMLSGSEKKLAAELKKCQLLCKKHHAEKSRAERLAAREREKTAQSSSVGLCAKSQLISDAT